MANASVNKVDVNNSRVINIVADTELTVKFIKNIQSVSIVNLSNNAIFFRNDAELATIESVNCIKLDASFKGFDLYSSTFFNEISFISSANSQIQLLNIR